MADQQTQAILKKRKLVKSLFLGLIGFGIGVLVSLAMHFSSLDFFSGKIKQLSALFELFLDIRLTEKFHWLGLSFFLGGVLFTGYKKSTHITKLVDSLFPDPPAFVRSNLEQARSKTMIHLENENLPLFGREAELEQLNTLLPPQKTRPFLWQALTGPSGVGKTRLAIEWLEGCQQQRWDVGLVDQADLHAIPGWKARRPTALVIDELNDALRLGETLYHLAQGASTGKEVRVLIVGQVEPSLHCHEGAWREAVMQHRFAVSSLCLAGLNDEAMQQLAQAAGYDPDRLTPKILRQLHNRPRKALIFFRAKPGTHSYIDAFRQWADCHDPALAHPQQSLDLGIALPLALAALAGPISVEAAHQGLGHNIDSLALQRYFTEPDRKSLHHTLPALEPDDLAQELLLRILRRLDPPSLRALSATALAANPDAMEQRLMSLWRERTDLFQDDKDAKASLAQLQTLQTEFDAHYPKRVDALRQEAWAMVKATATPPESMEEFEHLLHRLEQLVASRPQESEMRLAEAGGAVNAINYYGTAGQSEDLERWGQRLIRLAEHQAFAAHPEIRLQEAEGAFNAMSHYGTAGQFEDLERWGQRLIRLAEHEAFAAHPEIRLQEAQGAFNAMSHYGTAGQFEDLERWGQRLIHLAEHEAFAAHPEIRLKEAQGAFNALLLYAKQGAESEAAYQFWHNRLARVALEFPGHPKIQHPAKYFHLSYADQAKIYPANQAVLPPLPLPAATRKSEQAPLEQPPRSSRPNPAPLLQIQGTQDYDTGGSAFSSSFTPPRPEAESPWH